MSTDPHSRADAGAIEAMMRCHPRWTGIVRACDVLAIGPRTLLHAGPPVSDRCSLALPLKHSLLIAILFEGWASNRAEAEALLDSPYITLQPAQDFLCAVPLADVISPSMALVQIEDAQAPERMAYSTLNGGDGPVMRVGRYHPDVLRRLKWVNEHLASQVTTVIARAPLDLLGVADKALALGDDCHGRTQHGSACVLQHLLAYASPGELDEQVLTFLKNAPAFFLNLCMAAVKCCLLAAEQAGGESVVTAIGGNGSEFGVRIAGAPGRWFGVPATAPWVPGNDLQLRSRALGVIGDSAIVDAFGFGAMAGHLAPATAERLAIVCQDQHRTFPDALLQVRHPLLTTCTGVASGLTAHQVVTAGQGPVISLGMLDKQGLAGRLEGGFYFSPVAPFEAALKALGGDHASA